MYAKVFISLQYSNYIFLFILIIQILTSVKKENRLELK